ncbi:hypothetical protein ABTH15_19685, partial [Acinetobacter baumannii]
MKKQIILPFLLISMFAFSQGSNITFKMIGGVPTTSDPLTNLTVPINISFTTDFNTQELILKNNVDKQKFNDR